ncbi:hypothetical protein T09_14780 [Trichinella sp. T9]|nr:hypothetical protein T09_14780 [Trichinella sp. T9]
MQLEWLLSSTRSQSEIHREPLPTCFETFLVIRSLQMMPGTYLHVAIESNCPVCKRRHSASAFLDLQKANNYLLVPSTKDMSSQKI